MRRMAATVLGLFLAADASAASSGFWLPANDLRLRQDVTLLADEGVIRLPVTTWPIPVADVRRVVGRPRLDDIQDQGLQEALLRVRAAVAPAETAGEWDAREVIVSAGEPGLLRDYGTLGRENGELTSVGGVVSGRWSVNVRATVALSPQDDRELRFDGSDLSLQLGNWLVSVNALDRWWSPGYEGSLVLSTNARPMAQLSVDRAESRPFSVPVLSWLGPWRFSAFLGAGEGQRADVSHPVFMGMRVSFQPLQIVEFGLSRSAQFCGQNAARTRPSCDIEQVGRVLVGQDNVGYRGVERENEPGNQMAGFDMRLTSPFRRLPVALYAQMIGEDSSGRSKSVVPNRYLGLLGAEGWRYSQSGAVVRARVEYANTNCKWYAPSSDLVGFPNCAYRQGVFFAGYRYRDRNIGHTTDADAESVSASIHRTAADGSTIGFRLRRSQLDRYAGVDPFNPLTQGPSEHRLAEVSWSGRLFAQPLALQVGFEDQKDSRGPNVRGAFGFIQWRHQL